MSIYKKVGDTCRGFHIEYQLFIASQPELLTVSKSCLYTINWLCRWHLNPISYITGTSTPTALLNGSSSLLFKCSNHLNLILSTVLRSFTPHLLAQPISLCGPRYISVFSDENQLTQPPPSLNALQCEAFSVRAYTWEFFFSHIV